MTINLTVVGEGNLKRGWIRFGSVRGRGIAWKPRNDKALFSERNGYSRWYRFAFWRVEFFPPDNVLREKRASS